MATTNKFKYQEILEKHDIAVNSLDFEIKNEISALKGLSLLYSREKDEAKKQKIEEDIIKADIKIWDMLQDYVEENGIEEKGAAAESAPATKEKEQPAAQQKEKEKEKEKKKHEPEKEEETAPIPTTTGYKKGDKISTEQLKKLLGGKNPQMPYQTVEGVGTFKKLFMKQEYELV